MEFVVETRKNAEIMFSVRRRSPGDRFTRRASVRSPEFAGRNVQANERKFGHLTDCVRRANGGARRANDTGTLKIVLRVTFEP